MYMYIQQAVGTQRCYRPAAMTAISKYSPLLSSVHYDLRLLLLVLFSLGAGVDGRRGAVRREMDEVMPSLQLLSFSNNKLQGAIPTSFCRLQSLQIFDLSGNNFSGTIPDCEKISLNRKATDALEVVNFANNSLSGPIPSFFFSLMKLRYLQLNANQLSGEIPHPLARASYSSISVLDLGDNNISGKIPDWIAEMMPKLKILRLRSNRLTGGIPRNFASLKYLQLLDLANNELAGCIPHEFGNFEAMKLPHNMSESMLSGQSSTSNYEVSINVVMKGQEYEYQRLLSLVVSIDLSNNEFNGSIPAAVADLVALKNLNLSWNKLSGRIIGDIRKLQSLETLDLSNNELSGEIPTSMLSLTSLSHLNLSFNRLSGKIPQGNQFSTFMAPSFLHNLNLCGTPLKACEDEHGSSDHTSSPEEHHDIYAVWKYVFTASGFILGFWAICGTLILHNRWRAMFFLLLDDKSETLFEFINNFRARRYRSDDR